MARRKTKDQGIRKISKIGNYSLGITFPRSLLNSLGWREKQKVTAKKIRGGIVIRDWKSPKKK
jgi:antitoxin component of MazEF toxin-antitoxin module